MFVQSLDTLIYQVFVRREQSNIQHNLYLPYSDNSVFPLDDCIQLLNSFRNISWSEAEQVCKDEGLIMDDLRDADSMANISDTMVLETLQKGWHTFGHVYYIGLKPKVRI